VFAYFFNVRIQNPYELDDVSFLTAIQC